MRNLKIILAVMALTAVPVADAAAQQVIMMPVQSQEVALVNVNSGSFFAHVDSYVHDKASQNRIPTSPPQPPAPATSNHTAPIYY